MNKNYTNADIYEGDIKDNKRNGFGKMIYSNGDIYSGNWLNDKRHGEGEIKYSYGDIFKGNWFHDKKDGEGIIIINGEKYHGVWINDVQQKDLTTKSVEIKNQGNFGTCWAHAISRTFVRTLQILGIIVSEYSEDFYLLFYTILVNNKDCNTGGGFEDMVYLFNYLKKNYTNTIFDIKKSKVKCAYGTCLLEDENKPILNLPEFIKIKFIEDLKYLFENDILFLAIYEYDIDINSENKPTKAIKTMLDYRLQPYVEIKINKFLKEIISKQNNERSDIFPLVQPKVDINKNPDYKCIDDNNGHAVNLRRWKSNGVEFKNSWGEYAASTGNFSVPDLKYLICEKDGIINTLLIFSVLMFDYNKLNEKFQKIVDNKKILPTIDNSLTTKENNNYEGSLDKYGFLNGECELKHHDKKVFYKGNLIHGITFGKGVFYWPDGSRYDGDWVNNKMTGEGVMEWPNGNKYKGDWKDNKMNGKGVMEWPNGKKYKGDWKDNKMNGKGIMRLSNGTIYEGDFIDDKMNGKGVLHWTDGTSYDGNWFDNKMNGKGIMRLSNGTIYEGDFNDDKKHGKGVVHWTDGTSYDGDLKDNKMNGKGVMRWSNGQIYDGEWFNDKRSGKGIETNKDGSSYDGNWFDGYYQGKGIFKYADGQIYEGDWKSNKMTGEGVMEWPNGNKYKGEFIDGKLNGKGVMYYTNGITYSGDWKDDKRSGKGIETLSDGTKYSGDWVDGKRSGKGIETLSDGTKYSGDWVATSRIKLDNS